MDPSIAELLPEYFDNLRADGNRISAWLEQEDFEKIARTAHQLKGSGGAYGFPQLSELGARLEQAALACDKAGATTLTVELNETLSKLGRIYTAK